MLAKSSAICIQKQDGFVGARLVSALRAGGFPYFPIADFIQGALRPRVILLNRWSSVPLTTAACSRSEVQLSLLPLLELLDDVDWVGVDHVVFLSSAGAVYGPGHEAVDESVVPRPTSNYGAGKLAAEAFLAAAATRHGFALTVLRASNIYGPGQPVRAGFGVVPAIYLALSTGLPFEMWPGSDVRKDYLYIDDFIDALLRVLLGEPPKAGEVRVLNVASGYCASVPEIFDLSTRLRAWRPSAVQRIAGRIQRGRIIAPDAQRFRSLYGWQPRYDLLTGLKATFDWLDEQPREHLINPP
jgi:UDP-glucose 4-epimerase